MESRNCLVLLFVIMAGSLLPSQAHDFYVGGKDGWVLKPSESYVQWSQRNRFQISDSLVFKYNKETDSVVVVNKQDFDACSVSNPILKLEGGDSSYKFARSGKFYFITGNQSNCQNGQKLAVVVITPRIPRSPPGVMVPASAPGTTAGSAAPPSPLIVPSSAPISSPPEGSTFASPPSPPGVSPATAPSTSSSASPLGPPSASPGTAPSSSASGEPSSSPESEPPAIPGGDMPPAGSPGPNGENIAPAAAASAPVIIFSDKFVLGLPLLVTLALTGSFVSF